MSITAIEKQIIIKTFVYTCNTCGATYDTDETEWGKAVKKGRKRGWSHVIGVEGEVDHLCPICTIDRMKAEKSAFYRQSGMVRKGTD